MTDYEVQTKAQIEARLEHIEAELERLHGIINVIEIVRCTCRSRGGINATCPIH